MTIRLVTSDAEFALLRPAWEELFRANPNHGPFQSWEWNFSWWRQFGKPGGLRLLLAEQDGTLLGIAPLFVNNRFRGVPLRHLAFISRTNGEYLDFLVRPGAESVFFRELFAHLRSMTERWHLLELRDVSECSANLPFVLREAVDTFPALSLDAGEVCVAVPLSTSWEEFLTTLSKRARRHVGYNRRTAEKNFTLELKILTQPEAASAGLADLFAVYRSRWQRHKGATQFDADATARFARDVCEAFCRAGWYRLYLLYADQKPAAALLGYAYNGKLYVEIFAHSPEYEKYSLGNVLLGMAIEDCIANRWTEMDLTRGDEPYKFQWGGRPKRNMHVRVFRSRGAMVLTSLIEWSYQRGAEVQLLHRIRKAYRRWRLRTSVPQTGTAQPND
jgi:CelD/BcsL family acetyltransferase involved in cellulose biosynthesis